jgi:outer membrane receptor protein involved in Fe transport
MRILRLIGSLGAVALFAVPGMLAFPVSGWAQIEEIVVTTRKREESLQVVPVAVDVFVSQEIERKRLRTVRDLALYSSSLTFEGAAAPDAQKLSIRGLSPTRGRPNLAVLVDGIDYTTESIAQNGAGSTLNMRLMDVERIELVKGPQVALYGRSAFNGALQYLTKDPSDVFESEVRLEAGDFGRYNLRGSASGPIVDDVLGFRLNAAYWNEDGFYVNQRSGDTIGGSEGWGAAATLRFQPTEKFWFRFRGEYSDQQNEPLATVLVPANAVTNAPPGACEDQIPSLDGVQSVFECEGYGLGATKLVEGTDTDVTTFIEAAGNPNGVPLQAGPVSASNTPPSFYVGTLQSQAKMTQFRGVLPSQGSVGPVSLDVDPRTGQDFQGAEADQLRLSLHAAYDADFGSFLSVTGFYDGETFSIQDWQQAGDFDLCGTFIDPVTGMPTEPGPADSCVLGHNNNRHEIEQVSQELRFTSNWEFPVQMILGGLYWDEERIFTDGGGEIRSRSFDCIIDSSVPGGNVMLLPGTDMPVCGVFSVPITGEAFQQSLDARQTVFNGALNDNASRDTEHWSTYFSFDAELADEWSLIFEGRYHDETLSMRGTDSSGSGSTGSQLCGGGPQIASLRIPPPAAPGEPNGNNGCAGQFVLGGFPIGGNPFPALDGSTGGPPGLPMSEASFTVPVCDINFIDLERVSDTTTLLLNCDTRHVVSQRVGPADVENELIMCEQQLANAVIDAEAGMLTQDTIDQLQGNCFEVQHSASNDSQWFTPKVTLRWRPNDDLMFYGSWAHSEKPEGYNTVPFGSRGFQPSDDLFDAEKMDVTEIGAKTEWLNNTLRVNTALYLQDYTDKQVNTQVIVPDPINPGNFNTSPATINAAGAETWGLELDVIWTPDFEILGGALSLSASYTFLDAEYTDFAEPTPGGTDVYVINNCTPAPDPGADGIPNTADDIPICITDRSGHKLEKAPENAAVILGSFVAPFLDSDADWFFETDFQYTDKRFLEDANAVELDAFFNTNMRLGLQGEKYEFVFYVNNVFDDDTFERGHTVPALSSSFVFVHSRDLGNNGAPDAGVCCGSTPSNIRATERNGPAFNSAVAAASLRPPRHIGFEITMRF